jgi:hypothetical protein
MMNALVVGSYVLTGVTSLVFIYGLITRTQWSKSRCGIGWFLMAMPVGSLFLAFYMAFLQADVVPEEYYELARIIISLYASLVIGGFTYILYTKNIPVEIRVVKEEIIKEDR